MQFPDEWEDEGEPMSDETRAALEEALREESTPEPDSDSDQPLAEPVP